MSELTPHDAAIYKAESERIDRMRADHLKRAKRGTAKYLPVWRDHYHLDHLRIGIVLHE